MAEYDHLIKAITQRYTQHIAALVRGMEVTVEHVVEQDKEAVSSSVCRMPYSKCVKMVTNT